MNDSSLAAELAVNVNKSDKRYRASAIALAEFFKAVKLSTKDKVDLCADLSSLISGNEPSSSSKLFVR